VLVSHDVDKGLAECDATLGLRAGRQVLCERAAATDPARVRKLYL
jgi:hypothetical protein